MRGAVEPVQGKLGTEAGAGRRGTSQKSDLDKSLCLLRIAVKKPKLEANFRCMCLLSHPQAHLDL